VKKIGILFVPVLLIAAIYGCSKDHSAPTFGKFEGLMKQPKNLVATYIKSTDEFKLAWDMADTNSVKMYFIAWSDSNVFDLGKRADEFTNTVNKNYTLNATTTLKTMGYTAPKDSFIVYFTVSAVYNNSQFNEFIGPRSVVDSAMVYKK